MIKVANDLFGICKRLLRINKRYVVYWNNRYERFEVHTDGLEFIVPFPKLDCRTIEYALRTRIQNDYEIEREIDGNNARVERQAAQSMARVGERLQDMLGFANRTGCVTLSKDYMKEF